jgi:hypothetical protein
VYGLGLKSREEMNKEMKASRLGLKREAEKNSTRKK